MNRAGLSILAALAACAGEPELDPRVTVVGRPRSALGVAVDDQFVYWADSWAGEARIYRASKAGGDADLVLDQVGAYRPFVDEHGLWITAGVVLRHLAPDGSVTTIEIETSGDEVDGFFPGELVGDGEALYSVDPFHDTVARVRLDGAVTVIAGATELGGTRVAVDDRAVYFARPDYAAVLTTRIFRADKPELTPVQIAQVPDTVFGLAPGTDRLYIGQATSVASVDKNGGAVTEVVGEFSTEIDALAADGDTLFIHDAGCGAAQARLLRADGTGGGPPIELAVHDACQRASGVASDATQVYLAVPGVADTYFSSSRIFAVPR